MPETKMVDEVVTDRKPSAPARGLASRATHDESVGPDGKARAENGGVENENHGASPRVGRALPASTEALLAKMEKSNAEKPTLAPHEEGDADEDEPADDAGDADGEAGDDAGEDDGESSEAGEGGEDAAGDGEEGKKPEVDPTAPLKEQAARLEARNRELVTELDVAKKTPKAQRSERETALVAAEAAYIEEGSVPALRKFLAVVMGAAPDSKEVDAELSGLYTDLTARELGVALDDNQRNLRDNARTRLLLARDKREKVEAEKKPAADNSADGVRYEEAAKHVTGMLTTKTQTGTSLADEYPLLMTLAKDFDGFEPGEVLARAIRQDALAGSLAPNLSDLDMIRTVASKIEKHYDGVAQRIEAARAKKNKKPDTTTPSDKKPKAAVAASTEQRQSTGAPTITTTAASRAPATNPKVSEKPKGKTTTEKTRKDFPSESAWKDYLFAKHFKS